MLRSGRRELEEKEGWGEVLGWWIEEEEIHFSSSCMTELCMCMYFSVGINTIFRAALAIMEVCSREFPI